MADATLGSGAPKVLVAVLHTGQVRWELSAWLNHVIASERRASVMVKYYGCDQRSHPVDSNRNRILLDMPRDCDAVMMIDEDTVPIPEAIEVAFMACPESKGGLGLDVVLAPVPIVRGDDERGPVMANLVPLGAEGGSHDNVTIPVGLNRVVEIKEGGTGVIAIARHVVDHPALRAPFRFEYDEDGCTIVGEDHGFCRRVKEAGFKVHAALGYAMGHAKTVDLKMIYDMFSPGKAQQPRLIVTGTGRSGTGFAAQWLSSAGLRTGHEALFMYRGLDAAIKRAAMFRQFQADASWMASPYLDREFLAGVPVVHQMRHPRKVIQSWIRKSTAEHTPRYWGFVMEHAPEVGEQEREIDQFAARYVLWTELIERKLGAHPHYRWRVEDGEAGLLAWLSDRGILDPTRLDADNLFPDKSYNHKAGESAPLELFDISEPWRSRLAAISERYGYEW